MEKAAAEAAGRIKGCSLYHDIDYTPHQLLVRFLLHFASPTCAFAVVGCIISQGPLRMHIHLYLSILLLRRVLIVRTHCGCGWVVPSIGHFIDLIPPVRVLV